MPPGLSPLFHPLLHEDVPRSAHKCPVLWLWWWGSATTPHPLDQAPIGSSLFTHSNPPRTFYKQLSSLLMLHLQQHLESHLLFLAKHNQFKTKPKYKGYQKSREMEHLKSTSSTSCVHLVVRKSKFLLTFKTAQTLSYCLLGAFLAWVQLWAISVEKMKPFTRIAELLLLTAASFIWNVQGMESRQDSHGNEGRSHCT